jgi:hypothetical protein
MGNERLHVGGDGEFPVVGEYVFRDLEENPCAGFEIGKSPLEGAVP